MIEKVRRQLKIVLCFSPVGSVLRIRARKFPAIVNCTAIDWFHEWPHDALVSVSQRFLKEIPSLPVGFFLFSCFAQISCFNFKGRTVRTCVPVYGACSHERQSRITKLFH